MRRLRRHLLLAAVCALAVACSSDSPDGAESTTPTDASTTGAATTTIADADDSILDDETGSTDAVPAKVEPARDAGTVDAPAGVEPSGFATATVRVTAADGSTCDVCLWLADDGGTRSRGLMGVTDLGEPVGMLFRFDAVVDGNFFMFGTPMPLSIAWFGSDGGHVGQTDMAPCLTESSASCERYNPGATYVDAIEMVQGELGVVGIGPGSSIEVLATHDVCPETP